jgi:hypothetical protein
MRRAVVGVCPGFSKSVFKGLALTLSLLVQITLVPAGIVKLSGANLKSAIVICLTLPDAAPATVVDTAAPVVMAAEVAITAPVVIATPGVIAPIEAEGVMAAVGAAVVIVMAAVVGAALVVDAAVVDAAVVDAAVVGAAAGAELVVAVLSPQAARARDTSNSSPNKFNFLLNFIMRLFRLTNVSPCYEVFPGF